MTAIVVYLQFHSAISSDSHTREIISIVHTRTYLVTLYEDSENEGHFKNFTPIQTALQSTKFKDVITDIDNPNMLASHTFYDQLEDPMNRLAS